MTTLDQQLASAAARKAEAIPESFETARLIVRRSRTNDLDESFALSLTSENELAAWMPWAFPKPLRTSMETYFSTVEEKWNEREMLDFQVIEKSTNALVGKVGLHHIDWVVPKFEIGYWLGTPFVGRGYCQEAVEGLVAYACDALGAKRIEIRSQPANRRSRAVAERCGFALEGIARHYMRAADNSLADSCAYAKVFDDVPESSGWCGSRA
jgi:ribosomal-protein-serine acetyltransferase